MLKELRHASTEQIVLRSLILVCTVLFILLLWMAGPYGFFAWWTTYVPFVLGVITALVPQNFAPVVLLLYMVISWTLTNEDLLSPWTLAVVALMVLIHVASAWAGLLPIPAPVPSSVTRRWLGQMLVVIAVAAVVFGGVQLAVRVDIPGGSIALISGLVVLAVAGIGLQRWLVKPPAPKSASSSTSPGL